jgi:hypothetical protein
MIPYALHRMFSGIFLCLPLAVFIWAIRRWARDPERISKPRWRSYVAFVAFGLVSASSLLWFVSIIWAHVIGGFPFYDPVLLRFYRWGFLTSMSGLLTSFIGKGKLRWPACGLSALMTFLWLAAAEGE